MRRSAAPSLRQDANSSRDVSLVNAPVTSNTARNTASILNLLTKSYSVEDVSCHEDSPDCIVKDNIVSEVAKLQVPNSDSFNSENQLEEPARVYSVVWGKQTKKKHKTWEGDGTLEVVKKNVVLKDEEGKVLGRSSGVKFETIVEGARLFVGSKEVEIIELMSNSMKKTAQDVEPQVPAKKVKPSAKTKVPLFSPFSKQKNLFLKEEKPLIMPVPSHEHQWHHNTAHLPVVDVKVDPCLSRVLRPHQRAGVVFLYECVLGLRESSYHGAILADEMGLGKTLQCITLIWTLLKQGPYGGKPVIKKVLVVSPSSLVANWNKEFIYWLGKERLQVFTVDQKNKPKDFINLPRIPVMLISYEMFVRCYDDIEKINFDLLVCDEAHRLKNTAIRTTTLLSQLPCQRRILLTGTPIQNDLQELYSLVNFVNPGVIGSSSEFHKYFEEPIVSSRQPEVDEDVKELGEERAKELNHRTNWFILRRTQEINDQYLPSKHECVVFCCPTPLQKKLYEAAVQFWECRDEWPTSENVPHLAVITALKKICNHPVLLKTSTTHTADDYIPGEENIVQHLSHIIENFKDVNSVEHSGKASTVMSLLATLRNTRERVVLVSYFTQTLDMLAYLCGQNGYKYCRLDGTTPVPQRIPLVDKFNSSCSDYFVFLLSARAGGVGLNLTGASRLVLYDSDWNPATDLQAMSRIWRDGQKKSVYIYRLLTTGTVEEKIFQRQISKTDLSGAVIDPHASSTVKLSSEELKDLFTFHEETMCLTHDLLNCDCFDKGSVTNIQVESSSDCMTTQRDCQIQTTQLIQQAQNIRMNQLYEWEHHSKPLNSNILQEYELATSLDW